MSRLVVLLWIYHFIVLVSGHGRLLEPAGRSSMWRFGYDTPVNYNDNQLFCGGYRNTVVYDGKCGVCGDPFQGPFDNEAGGKYATGTIVRYYDVTDEYINVTVDISAHHRGQFEFRLCPHNDVNTRVTQECLDQHVLQVEGGEDDGIHFIPAGSGIHHLRVGIPHGVTCSQCVLQWKYTTGNFWGVDKTSGGGCIGCGDQELFVNCADIAIGDDTLYVKTKTNTTKSATYVKHDEKPHDHGSHYRGYHHGNATRTYKSDKPEECNRCYALPTWQHFPDMDNWCDSNCKLGNCPPCRCYCGCPRIKFDNPCVGTGEYDTFDKMAGWCWRECCESECPIDKCACTELVKYPSSSGYKVQKQFFEHPLVNLFPGSKASHHHDNSHDKSISDDDDDSGSDSSEARTSSESVDNDDDSSSSEDRDHAVSSLYDVNIKPPGEALTSANILSDLVQKHRITLPGVLHPKKHEVSSNSKESDSPQDNHLSDLLQGTDSQRQTLSNKGSNSDTSRLNSFVLSEVRVMKVNKTRSKRKHHVTDYTRPKENFLSRFSLREVHRTKVDKTAPSEATPAHHLSISLPQLVSFILGDKTNKGKSSHPGHSSKLASTKSPPSTLSVMSEHTSPSIARLIKTTATQLISETKSKSSPVSSVTKPVINSLSSMSESASSQVPVVSMPSYHSHHLTTKATSFSDVDRTDMPIMDGSLTAQSHAAGNQQSQSTINDVSSTTTERDSRLTSKDPLQKDPLDFIQKMAVDPRLLSSAIDLHQFSTDTGEKHRVKASTADKSTHNKMPDIRHITGSDATFMVNHPPTTAPQDIINTESSSSVNSPNYLAPPGDITSTVSTSKVDNSINTMLPEAHNHAGSSSGDTKQHHFTTESSRKDDPVIDHLSENSPSVTQTPQIKIVSDKLFREVSRNIHEKKIAIGSILNEETDIKGRSPQTKSVSYSKLNFAQPEQVNEAAPSDVPYVVDARLLNKMLETVQSWINHPMYVVH